MLKQQYFNTYKCSNHDKIKFISLSQKVAYPYEHMDDWKKFNETSLLEKKICSHTDIEDITDADYKQARVYKYFEI